MKKRWAYLFWSALATLIGMAWLSQRVGMSMTDWVRVQLVGMIVAASVALWAMISAQPRKWPAAVVLIGAAPMGQTLWPVLRDFGVFVQLIGFPGILMVLGILATVIAAVAILVMRPPAPPPDDPVARARVVS